HASRHLVAQVRASHDQYLLNRASFVCALTIKSGVRMISVLFIQSEWLLFHWRVPVGCGVFALLAVSRTAC
ncbi:hypothetical protein GGX14DRAFT_449343, partial [Mycena pura]